MDSISDTAAHASALAVAPVKVSVNHDDVVSTPLGSAPDGCMAYSATSSLSAVGSVRASEKHWSP